MYDVIVERHVIDNYFLDRRIFNAAHENTEHRAHVSVEHEQPKYFQKE